MNYSLLAYFLHCYYIVIGLMLSDIDECANDPCANDGTCTTPEIADFLCTCTEGFTGNTCLGI